MTTPDGYVQFPLSIPGGTRQPARHRTLLIVLAAVLAVVIGVVGIGVISVFAGKRLGHAYKVQSGSMAPTLKADDRILAAKIKSPGAIKQGWIVTFNAPADAPADEKGILRVKRVVAVPGDSVSAVNGRLYVNGQLDDEPYLAGGVKTDHQQAITLKAGQYWLLGDDRSNSADSRFYGAVNASLIRGHVTQVILPLSHRKSLD